MSKNNKDGLQISWFGIIVMYAIFWPAGLILTLMKVLPWFESAKNQNSGTNQNSANRTNQNQYSAGNTANAGRAQNTYSSTSSVNRNPYSKTYNTSKMEQNQGTAQKTADGQNVDQKETAKSESPAVKNKTANLYKPKKALPVLLFVCAAIALTASAAMGINAVSNYFVNSDFGMLISSLITGGAFALAGGAGIISGSLIKDREQRYRRYSAIIGDKESVYIPTVAKIMNMSYKKVSRDLQKMVDEGIFGKFAYIDQSSKHLMRSTEAAMERPDAAPKAQPEKEQKNEEQKISGKPETEYESILRRIRELNDAIADEEVSTRIDEIENTTAKIFDCVAQNPDKLDDIRTFMNYYLPTTLKLLTSYSQIEKFGIEGENISSAKQNIEKILSILAVGFNQQLDRLYASEALDISSDIDVLEQMMFKDGLTTNTEQDILSFGDQLTKEQKHPMQEQIDLAQVAELMEEYSDDLDEISGTAMQNKPETK